MKPVKQSELFDAIAMSLAIDTAQIAIDEPIEEQVASHGSAENPAG